tara:strand:+ start:315 stop:974 length:660 start_codon:yes stop_codon:yes gene_type:complete
MGQEINLLKNYPITKRDTSSRANEKTEKDRSIARKFGKEFFDGDRKHGYGGFKYMSRFWEPVVPTFKKHWNLNSSSTLLDVGCAKGFMLYDFKRLIPGISLTGIDVSEYAIENTLTEVRDNVKVADAKLLPFENNSFDATISINTIHNLEIDECAQALKEIERVSRGKSFITVDAFRDSDEEKRMYEWNLTAKTILSVVDWLKLFKDVGYTGDYYWFIP